MKLCSLVVPCYNEQEAIPHFYAETEKTIISIKNLSFEYIFIDDGSTDATLEILKKLSRKDKRIHFISFSRNFGKEAALLAGLQKAKGDFVATMDVDLQDPPALLPQMYAALVDEGFDCAATRRTNRKGEPPIRSFFAHLFYRLINKMSRTGIVDGARDYRFMSRAMVNAILTLKEYNRFSKGIFGWVGFKTKWIDFENVERVAGRTKWSFWSLFLYSLEGIVAFSTSPLSLVSVVGLFICFIAFVMLGVIFLRAFLYGDPVAGWPSLISIIIFLGGIQLFSTGIMGLYLAKTYTETKNRPIFIVREEK